MGNHWVETGQCAAHIQFIVQWTDFVLSTYIYLCVDLYCHLSISLSLSLVLCLPLSLCSTFAIQSHTQCITISHNFNYMNTFPLFVHRPVNVCAMRDTCPIIIGFIQSPQHIRTRRRVAKKTNAVCPSVTTLAVCDCDCLICTRNTCRVKIESTHSQAARRK